MVAVGGHVSWLPSAHLGTDYTIRRVPWSLCVTYASFAQVRDELKPLTDAVERVALSATQNWKRCVGKSARAEHSMGTQG